MKHEKQTEFEPDPLQHHPPERREQKKKYVVLYSCCCCCCCCLHTLGSAIGAGIAGDFQPEPAAPRAQGMFWKCVLAVAGIALAAMTSRAIATSSNGFAGSFVFEGFWVWLAGLVMLGPLVMLVASLLMALWISVRSDLPSRGEYYRKLLRITFGNVVGCVLGIAVMWLIAICL